jgi:hypothetical protein
MPATPQQVEIFFRRVTTNELQALQDWFTKEGFDADIVESLMTAKYDGPMNAQYKGKTGLAIACSVSDAPLALWLLEQTSTILADERGDYPMHNVLHAPIVNSDIVIAILAKLKLEVHDKTQLTQLDRMGYTALSYSVTLPDPDMRHKLTNLLLDNGFDIDAGEDDAIPLITAIRLMPEHRDTKMIELLLARDADIFSSTEDIDNSLLVAANEGYKAAARMILEKARSKGEATVVSLVEDIDSHKLLQWLDSPKESAFDDFLVLGDGGSDKVSAKRHKGLAAAAACDEDSEDAHGPDSIDQDIVAKLSGDDSDS